MKRALGRHLDMRHLRRAESDVSRARGLAFGCDDVAAEVQRAIGDKAKLVTAYPVASPGLCVVVCVATLGDEEHVGDEVAEQGERSAPHHQTELALASPSMPAQTRGACSGGLRPCHRYACTHHNWPQTERPGRPHSGRHNLPVLRQVGESCTLDVADRGWHTNTQVGLELGVTKERVRQIVDRATDKMAIAQAVLTGMEHGLRSRLYQRALVTFDYHRVADPNRIVVTGVIVPNDYDRPAVQVRRRT